MMMIDFIRKIVESNAFKVDIISLLSFPGALP
jgi:hypothetical protein